MTKKEKELAVLQLANQKNDAVKYFERKSMCFENAMTWISICIDGYNDQFIPIIKLRHPEPYCMVYEFYMNEVHICNLTYQAPDIMQPEEIETTIEWINFEKYAPEEVFEDFYNYADDELYLEMSSN